MTDPVTHNDTRTNIAGSRFEGRVALVTGALSGIGLAIAGRLRDEGATVYTAQRRNSGDAYSISADLTDPASPAQVVEEVVARAGRLDILVNNAGMMQESPVEETTVEDWNRALAVNLTAPFLLIRAALPHLRSVRGCIVNTGSVEGDAANPGHAAYGATKSGLHGLTRAVAVDAGHHGVRCNAVAPGWIDTDLNRSYVDGAQDPDAFRRRLDHIHPLRRTGSAEDVAGVVAFLASEDARFVTGQIYTVDGGRTTQLSLP
ncbi:SDR family NAD(P)-dependent oxidoreductase [Corynebacterium glyciniphilum]|uniref:SDR family NAD(P)-dependent oxidoreductase n=1 Tax=Corynebacterium glyciniphilum TaxID=1404244 RepID=UPI001C92FAC6|nr:SDR family oxidoreductase [Corynebacterium glyciniphilum]